MGHAKHLSESDPTEHTRDVEPSDLPNLIEGEHPGVTSVSRLPTLGYAVPVVVSQCAHPKVVRVDAVSNVAAVENTKTVWHWSFMDNPGKNMGTKLLGIQGSPGPLAYPSVTLVSSSGPKPACIGLANFAPEPYSNINSWS